jgi:hypothetical protein
MRRKATDTVDLLVSLANSVAERLRLGRCHMAVEAII